MNYNESFLISLSPVLDKIKEGQIMSEEEVFIQDIIKRAEQLMKKIGKAKGWKALTNEEFEESLYLSRSIEKIFETKIMYLTEKEIAKLDAYLDWYQDLDDDKD